MALTPLNVEPFGGLDMVSDPEEVGLGGALDTLNIDFNHPGRVRSRDGYTLSNAVACSSSIDSLLMWPALYATVAGGDDFKLYLYTTVNGTLAATSSAYSGVFYSGVPYGTGTTSYFYAAQGTAGTIVRVTSAAVFSQPAGMPTARYLAVQPSDNRLVAVYTGTTKTSRVEFSNAGDAETWGANNYVDLTPNDGETVCSPVAWRGQLFVFKQTQFFVFYGNSTDSTGSPVFNYRPVTTGVGARPTLLPSAVAAPDAVYFVGWDGIYRTTGGEPQKISGAIDPLFTGVTAPFCASIAPPLATHGTGVTTITYYRGGIYVPVTDSAGHFRTLVYDIASQRWSVWQVPVQPYAMAVFPFASVPDRLAFSSGTSMYTYGLTDTTDAGTAITSRYRSGFSDLGGPGTEKTIRQTELNGQGTVSLGWSRDFGAITTTSTANVTSGTAPTTARGLHRLAQNGEQLGYQIASVTGGAWALNRITPMVRPFRQPGDKTT